MTKYRLPVVALFVARLLKSDLEFLDAADSGSRHTMVAHWMHDPRRGIVEATVPFDYIAV